MRYLNEKTDRAMHILSEIGPAKKNDLKTLADLKEKDIDILKTYKFIKEKDGICFIPGQAIEWGTVLSLSVAAACKNKITGMYPAQFPFKLMFMLDDQAYYVTYVKRGEEPLMASVINNYPYYSDDTDAVIVITEDPEVQRKMDIKRPVEFFDEETVDSISD